MQSAGLPYLGEVVQRLPDMLKILIMLSFLHLSNSSRTLRFLTNASGHGGLLRTTIRKQSSTTFMTQALVYRHLTPATRQLLGLFISNDFDLVRAMDRHETE